tara:strand:- start:1829 stop:2941 length:1113 start_codon:yes stop_codon:yes gene_type:complete
MRASLIIWSDPSLYINLLFIVQKLLKKNYRISIFYRENLKNNKNLRYFKFLNKTDLIKINSSNLNYFNKISFFLFLIKVIICNLKLKPDLLIGFNFHGYLTSYIINLFSKKTKLINYNFDFNYLDSNLSEKIQTYILKLIIKKANVTITPSYNRSMLYKKKYNLTKKPLDICNTFPKNFLIKTKKRNKRFKTIIRLGSYNESHNLENLILSTVYFPSNYKLILAGVSYNNYYEKLEILIKKNNLKKVTLLKNVNYSEWFKILKKGDLGIAFYDQVNTSHRNMAGTSQKFNNYLLAGIPCLVNKNKDFIEFNKKYNVLYIQNKNSPKDISKKIIEIFKNKKIYNKKIQNSKKLFLKELNFEKQYEKLELYI